MSNNISLEKYTIEAEQKARRFDTKMNLWREYTLSSLSFTVLFTVALFPAIMTGFVVYHHTYLEMGFLAIIAAIGTGISIEAVGIVSSKVTINLYRIHKEEIEEGGEGRKWQITLGILFIVAYAITGSMVIITLESENRYLMALGIGSFVLALVSYVSLALFEEVRIYRRKSIIKSQKADQEFSLKEAQHKVELARIAQAKVEVETETDLITRKKEIELQVHNDALRADIETKQQIKLKREETKQQIKLQREGLTSSHPDSHSGSENEKPRQDYKVSIDKVKEYIESHKDGQDVSVNELRKHFGLGSWATASKYKKLALNGHTNTSEVE